MATLPARMTPPVAADTTAVIGAGAVPVMESGFTGGAVVTPTVVGADTVKLVGRSATPVLAATSPTTFAPPLAEVVLAVTDSWPVSLAVEVPGAFAAGAGAGAGAAGAGVFVGVGATVFVGATVAVDVGATVGVVVTLLTAGAS